jgi:redox-sensitive bicupin YhaK (pirin superfamily)
MIEHRPLSTLGGGDYGWLQAHHHFAFAGVGNPSHRTIGALKVWNDDTIAPGSGFPMHFHRDIEIVTFVREGAITHEDSLGNKGRTAAGSVQVMSAGTGIRHAEYNAEPVPTRMFQIWLETRHVGSPPRWSARTFPSAERLGRFVTLASGRQESDGLPIDADADVLGARAFAGETLTMDLTTSAYVVPTSGRICVNGVEIAGGDGAAVVAENRLSIFAIDDAEIVVVALI